MAKSNKTMCTIENPKDYISDAVLDAIYSIEGHDKGVENVDKLTTYYGITKNGLAQLKELKNDFYAYVPERLLKLKLDDVTKEDAREITGYIAIHNSLMIDKHFGDNHTFMNLPLSVRSAVLSLYHTGGARNIADSWKDPQAKGSIMKAFETGSTEKIAKAILSNSDGTLFKGSDKGRLNRLLSAVRLMYDTDNESFKTIKDKDKVFDKWSKEPGVLQSTAKTLDLLDADMTMRKQREESARRMAYYAGYSKPGQENNMSEEKLKQPRISTPAPQPAEQIANQGYMKFATDFTNWLKKYFTKNDKEENTNATGNTDINMQ